MSVCTDRQSWMSLLATAPAAEVDTLWRMLGLSPDFSTLRPPEVGAVMVRGRAGATGAPFNLGEMTVTRCSVRLSGGEVGHGYVQGRDKAHAERAALIDALMQTDRADCLRRDILGPLSEHVAARRADRAARAAATKVEFFTVARGED